VNRPQSPFINVFEPAGSPKPCWFTWFSFPFQSGPFVLSDEDVYGYDVLFLCVYMLLRCAACLRALDLGFGDPGSIQHPWYVWMVQDPYSLGPGLVFCADCSPACFFCYFIHCSCFLHLFQLKIFYENI
jgi:hypothetical protein